MRALWSTIIGSPVEAAPTTRTVLPSADSVGLDARLAVAVEAAVAEYETTRAPLSNVDLTVAELLEEIEACVMHGLRGGPASLWPLLLRTDECAARAGVPQPILAATIASVATLRYVHTDVGRSRAWIRKSLNGGHAGLLQRSLDVLVAEPGLVRASYFDGSYMRDRSARRGWTDSLQKLSRVPFDLDVDSAALDAVRTAAADVGEAAQKSTLSVGVGRSSSDTDAAAVAALRRHALESPRGRAGSREASGGRSTRKRRSSNSGLTPGWLESIGSAVVGLAQTAAKAVGGGDAARMPSALGQTLAVAVRDVDACLMAPADPLLGIPLFPLRCCDALDALVKTKTKGELRGMWHGAPTESDLDKILVHFQVSGKLPPAISAVQLGTITKLYLHSLTEPLLTHALFDEFLDAAEIAERTARLARLRALLARVPAEHKPLLSRIVRCVRAVLRLQLPSGGGAIDGDAKRDIGRSLHRFAPSILRAYAPAESSANASKAVSAATSKRVTAVVKLLVLHQKDIFVEIRAELRQRECRLRNKVKRLRRLAMQRHEPIDVDDREHLSMLRGLWTSLAVQEEVTPATMEGAATEGAATPPQESCEPGSPAAMNAARGTFPAGILSPFWRTRGFQGKDPRVDFGGGGVLALRCLAFFVSRHKESALRLTLALRRRGVPFATVGANVCHTLAELACLKAEKIGIRPGFEMLENAFWRVADDGAAFERLFCLFFFMVAAAWEVRDYHPMEFNMVLAETRKAVVELMARVVSESEQREEETVAARLAAAAAAPAAMGAGVEATAAAVNAIASADADAAESDGAAAAAAATAAAAAAAGASGARGESTNSVDDLWVAWLDGSPALVAERSLVAEALTAPSLDAVRQRRDGGEAGGQAHSVSAAWRFAAAIGGAVVGAVDRAVSAIGAPGEGDAGVVAASSAGDGAADPDEGELAAAADGSAASEEGDAPRKRTHQLLADASGILEEAHMSAVVAIVPQSLQEAYEWTLTYSLLEHGASLQTMYRCCEGSSASILCVRTIDNCVFGCFATEAWEKQSGYFGSGEAFLFTFARDGSAGSGEEEEDDENDGARLRAEVSGEGERRDDGAAGDSDVSTRMRAYRWTGVRALLLRQWWWRLRLRRRLLRQRLQLLPRALYALC